VGPNERDRANTKKNGRTNEKKQKGANALKEKTTDDKITPAKES